MAIGCLVRAMTGFPAIESMHVSPRSAIMIRGAVFIDGEDMIVSLGFKAGEFDPETVMTSEMDRYVLFYEAGDILILRQDADTYVLVRVIRVDEGNYGLGPPPRATTPVHGGYS